MRAKPARRATESLRAIVRVELELGQQVGERDAKEGAGREGQGAGGQ